MWNIECLAAFCRIGIIQPSSSGCIRPKTRTPPQKKRRRSKFLNFGNNLPVDRQLSRLKHDKVKVKQSLYRPIQALRVPGDRGTQISRQSAHAGGKVVSPTHRPLYPPRNITDTNFCWRLSRPQGHSAVGRIMWMKNSNDTIGNRTRDLRLVAQCLNQLRHRVPAQHEEGSSDLARTVFTIGLLLLLLLLLRCFCYCCCLVSQAFSPWHFSWTNGDPHRSGSTFRLQYFPFYVWCSQYSCPS